MNEILETYTMTPEEEIKWLRQCVRELQEEKEILKSNNKILNTQKEQAYKIADDYYKETQQLKEENDKLKKQLETLEKSNIQLISKLDKYDAIVDERDELKSQLEEYKQELEKADSITQSCIFNGKKNSSISYRKCLNMLENLKEENKQLKKQLEENKNPLKGIFEQVSDDTLLRDCGNMNAEINELKNQQKKFIKYINDIIEDLETEDVDDEEMKGYLIQRIDTFKEILSKYKKIIGENK